MRGSEKSGPFVDLELFMIMKATVGDIRKVIKEELDAEKENLWQQIKDVTDAQRDATGENPFQPEDSDSRDSLNKQHWQLMAKYRQLVGKHWPNK